MSEERYFEKALSNFTYEAASGGAIRHLFDSGFTVQQIVNLLKYPTPFDRVQKTVWEHMVQSGMILLEKPGTEEVEENVSYRTEFDRYGKRSFRQVRTPSEKKQVLCWKERTFMGGPFFHLQDSLAELCEKNGEKTAYVSCDFGVRIQRDMPDFESELRMLDDRQKEYILGIPWKPMVVYHRLNSRMREIVGQMYENGRYHGVCYFSELEEMMKF
ncbi:MAG: hypothetical protein ACI39W_10895 [Brotaphodocola sp.]